MIPHNIDGVTFNLQETHDFEWLSDLGEVFAVFDQQDSGNISFGVRNQDEKRFVKYAGAKTTAYRGHPVEAIDRLIQSISIYKDLEHSHLIKFIDCLVLPEGFAAIFEWFDGENLHPHWSFPPPAKYTDPNSPYFQFKQLSIEDRKNAIDTIFAFHQHVAKMNYVAVDFYDGSLLYDFASKTMKICDIDLYKKRPFINEMGRLWGSSRFMSPEEFTLSAEIDEKTNVFNMGAMAFALLGGEVDRSLSQWEAGLDLYEVAARAVEPERDKRYPSMDDFIEAWQNAK